MTTTITRREDLDPDPAAAYTAVAGLIGQHTAALAALTGLRDQILRELAGTDRGGVARVARVAGVTNTQAGRLLAEGLARAVRAAAFEAGFERGEFRVRPLGQAHPARVALALKEEQESAPADPEPGAEVERERERSARERAAWIARMNVAGALLAALRRAGLSAVADNLGMDVDGEGPRAALARGDEVEVFWA